MRATKIIGKILLVIVSILLCIALFAATLVTMLVADVKVATNKDNLQNILNQTLSAPYQQTSLQPVSLAAGSDVSGNVSSGGLSDVLIGFLFDSLQEMAGEEAALEFEQVKQFIEESTVKDFLAEKSASIISDIYTGERNTTISADEIISLIKENNALIKEYFSVEIPTEQMEELKQMIEQIPMIRQIQESGIMSIISGSSDVAPDEEIEEAPVDIRDTWYGKLPGFSAYIEEGGASNIMNNPVALYLEIVRFYTSDTVLWLCIGACAVLIGLLFLCAWKKPYKAMINSGISLLVAGCIFLIPTLIAWLAPATWMNIFSFEPAIGTISRFVLLLTGGVCGAVSGIGAVLIAGGITLKVVMRKKAAALEEAPVEQIPAEETAEETPVEEAPAEELPAEEASVEETPVEETPVEETPAEEVPAEAAPVEEAPAEETI